MSKKLFCLLALLILSACNHAVFKVPCVVKRTTSVNETGAVCIVEDQCTEQPPQTMDIYECNNAIGVDTVDYLTLYEFYDDKLARLEICLKHPKKCK